MRNNFSTRRLSDLRSSGQWRRVDWKICTNVSEKVSASILMGCLKNLFTCGILHGVPSRMTAIPIFTAVGPGNIDMMTQFVQFEQIQYPISIRLAAVPVCSVVFCLFRTSCHIIVPLALLQCHVEAIPQMT